MLPRAAAWRRRQRSSLSKKWQPIWPRGIRRPAAAADHDGGGCGFARAYLIPGGGSNATAALGFVNCAFERVSQANGRGLVIDHLVTATGSAGTQAGLITGLKAINAGIPLLEIGVQAHKDKQEENVFKLAQLTAQMLGCPNVVKRGAVVADTSYVGRGCGSPREDTSAAAVRLPDRSERPCPKCTRSECV